MSGRFTPTSSLFTPTTSEYSASEALTGTSSDSIGTFILRVTCDNPAFDETVLVLADEEAGIVDSAAEFTDTICKSASQAAYRAGHYDRTYDIQEIRLPISNKHIIVTARQLFSIIWRLPRIPGLVTPNLISNMPNSNRIHVFLDLVF
jgi:hypothetical protein